MATALTLPELVASVQPGDMIGFSGADLLSDAINLGSLGWPRRGLSHVGIIGYLDDRLCLYESTSLGTDDCLIQGKRVSGAQCQPIGRRVRNYKGRVWYYPLAKPLHPTAIFRMEGRLRKLCVDHCPYDVFGAWHSRSMVVGWIWQLKFGREDLTELFCSELVAKEWALAKLLDTSNSSKWNPNSLARYAVRHGITYKPTEVVL